MPSPIPVLNVRLLGAFQVRHGIEPIAETAWSRRNARTLFKYLLLSPNHRCTKEQALDLLWPTLDPGAAANNLHKTLFYLRRTLCPSIHEGRTCPYVEFDGDIVGLAHIGEVDAELFETRGQSARGSSDAAQYTAALDLYGGDLLPDDLYADWAATRRESLRRLYLTLFHQLGELYLTHRDYEPAIAIWSHLLAAEPADEAAHRTLMRVYALNGQRHQALRQYHLCRQALETELNVKPSPETTALYGAITQGVIGPELTVVPTPLTSTLPHSLIGRQAELNALLATLEAVADGTPRFALITGEAGIGKTRLAYELAHLADERGFTILVGNMYESVGALQELPLPYGPVVEALRRFLGSQRPDIRQQLVGPWQTDLMPLLPELGAEPSQLEPEIAKRRVFEAIAQLLSTLATIRPVLLWLDDLHAADESTLELLGYLLHRPAPFRVMVLGIAREDSLSPINRMTPLAQLLARIARRGTLMRLTLARLSPAETEQLVADRLAGTVDTSLTNAIYETSEGNPLFIEQLLQAWREEDLLLQASGHWRVRTSTSPESLPSSVRDTIALRLARLSPETQSMLALAAVIGREFPYLWLQVAGAWAEDSLLDWLDEALQAHVLEESSAQKGPLLYRFQHGLIRQTLYGDLSEARRRHHHQRVAETLEHLADAPYGALSYHWFASGRWPWAFCHALSAADLARRAFANAEAVALYDRALASIQESWQPGGELLAQVHLGRAQALMGLNRSAEAVADLEWLADQAQQTGDRARYGQAISQLATAHFWAHNLEAARRLAQEGLAIAQETGDGMTAMMCASNLGCIALSTGKLEQGTQYLETVLAQVRAFGQPGQVVEALACLPGGYHWQGASARSLPLLEEGITIARREGLSFWLGNMLFFAGLACGSLCHYEQALDYFRQGQRHSQEAGDIFTAIRVANSLGWIHHELYAFPTALAYDQQGVEMARGFPWPEPLANALVNLGVDHLALNNGAAANQAFAEATALLNQDLWMEWRWHTRLLLGQGWLALDERDISKAENLARQALVLAQETTAHKNQARAYLLLGEISLTKDDALQATVLFRQAIDLAKTIENARLLWQSLDALARAKATQGNRSAAADYWAQAEEAIQIIAQGLRDQDLRRTFLEAKPVQRVLRSAKRE